MEVLLADISLRKIKMINRSLICIIVLILISIQLYYIGQWMLAFVSRIMKHIAYHYQLVAMLSWGAIVTDKGLRNTAKHMFWNWKGQLVLFFSRIGWKIFLFLTRFPVAFEFYFSYEIQVEGKYQVKGVGSALLSIAECLGKK